MKVYIVCYDVSNDHTRGRIAKILRKYGERVQYSVFEVRLRSDTQLQSLCEQLRAVADEETDIRFYRLCENCRKDSRSLEGEPMQEMPAVIIV